MAGRRVFRTAGGVHKFEDDLDADDVAFLAYTADEDLPHPVAAELGVKQADGPSGNKMVDGPPSDKSRTVFKSANVDDTDTDTDTDAETFSCDVDGCDFTTESERGLSIHTTAKHG